MLSQRDYFESLQPYSGMPLDTLAATKDSRDEQKGFNAFRVQKNLGATVNTLPVCLCISLPSAVVLP